MKTKANLQNISTNSILTNWANNVMTMHAVKKEWKIAIITSFILKLATMVYSILAAYSYLYNLIFEQLQNKTQATYTTILFLLLLEIMVSVFMEKMFKFSFRERPQTALASFVVVVFFFTISFHLSTNGLAEKQAKKTDQTFKIEKTNQLQKQDIINDYQKQIQRKEKLILTIENNPQGWSNGKRTNLIPSQQNKIDSLQSIIQQLTEKQEQKINQLNQQTAQKLESNNQTTQVNASKYYKIMSGVMLLQFFVNGLLVFFLHLIRNEEQPDEIVKEEINNIQNAIQLSSQNIMQNAIVTALNKFTDIANAVFTDYKFPDQKPIEIENKKPDKKLYSDTEKKIGFQFNFDTKKETQKNEQSSKRFDTSEHFNTSNLEYLKKHKNLVKTIIKLQINTTQNITNQDIKLIQQNSPRNIQKSPTTIQKVFTVMQTIGIDKINFI